MSAGKRANEKAHLVRGIDEIPEDWELASAFRAIQALNYSITQLERLATQHPSIAPPLRRAVSAMRCGLNHITGGFPRNEIEPRARKIALLRERQGEEGAA